MVLNLRQEYRAQKKSKAFNISSREKFVCAISRQCNREEKNKLAFIGLIPMIENSMNIESMLDKTMGRSTSSVVAIWVLGDWKCAMSCRNIKINSLPGPILNFWEPNNCYLHNRYDIYIVSIEMTCKLTFVRFASIRFDSFLCFVFDSMSLKTDSFGDCMSSILIKSKSSSKARCEIKSVGSCK